MQYAKKIIISKRVEELGNLSIWIVQLGGESIRMPTTGDRIRDSNYVRDI